MKGYENIIVAYNNLILFGFKLNLYERRSYNNIFTYFTNCPLKNYIIKRQGIYSFYLEHNPDDTIISNLHKMEI